MLINLEKLISKYNVHPTGVIHVGAHHGQEFDTYIENGINHVVFIEPSSNAFNVLQERLSNRNPIGGSLELINAACGAENTHALMNLEASNSGQSNSLLKPKNHLLVHPEIKFAGQEEVKVARLDALVQPNPLLDLLMMDVQGYEKFVVMGATGIMPQIKYVYSEVNKSELYEGCTLIEQLDALLQDFTRLETTWCGDTGWGDAFYMRTSLLPQAPPTFVPRQFRQAMPFPYPEDNSIIFEEWFFFNQPEAETERIYLPIFWTSYYVRNDYGQNEQAIAELQEFLNSLDTSKKYYTIVQFDDGILNDISHLDIKVFAMAGNRIDYAIPLLCMPHDYVLDNNTQRRFIANFVGSDNHPIRMHLIRTTKMLSRFFVRGVRLDMDEFCNLLGRSIFTLCPRGYGKTSFRIAEALQYGSIPVYISDSHVLPFNDVIPFTEYGLVLKPEDIKGLPHLLTSLSNNHDELNRLRQNGAKAYKELYSYQGAQKIILSKIDEVL